jgi:hypothetical protein
MRPDVKNVALIVTIMILGNATALADTSRYTATLAQPVSAKTDFIVNGNMFRCDGSTCILVSTPADAASVHTCRALQRKVGTLTAYGAEGTPFNAAKLAQCNAPNSF